ncbi:uncharacterized protein LOC112589782 [Harpegnathos saltator]|uniref:uncharacterized protein LOC112589782 n=1 Tax=Harpegnathos saltator TaxID=610380 RepID=UPI000DBEEB45|nr:uncharacterized protein LOC112589782 [Harpegnathos saltator]
MSGFQLMSLITMEYSMDFLLKILAYNIPWMGFTIKYNILCFNIKDMRRLLELAQNDWKQMSDAQDIEIIKKYWAIGRLITSVSASKRGISFCACSFVRSLTPR